MNKSVVSANSWRSTPSLWWVFDEDDIQKIWRPIIVPAFAHSGLQCSLRSVIIFISRMNLWDCEKQSDDVPLNPVGCFIRARGLQPRWFGVKPTLVAYSSRITIIISLSKYLWACMSWAGNESCLTVTVTWSVSTPKPKDIFLYLGDSGRFDRTARFDAAGITTMSL